MKLIILAALTGWCAAYNSGYDYTPPLSSFDPRYYNYQNRRPATANGFRQPYNTDNGYYYQDPRATLVTNPGGPGFNNNGFGNDLNINSGYYYQDNRPVEFPVTPARQPEISAGLTSGPGLNNSGVGNEGSQQLFPSVITGETGQVVTSISETPWHAGVYKKTTSPYMQICGGSLVTNNVIISAAHCFWRSSREKLLPASNYTIAVGKLYRSWDDANDMAQRQRRDIREIKVPPRYYGSATNFQDDLALLILSSPVQLNKNVQTVLLSFDREIEDTQLQTGNQGMVAGWGLTAEDGQAAQVLQVVRMPYVPVERCLAESPPEFLVSITSDKICAGYQDGTAVCMGDSGGGLVFPSKDGNYLRGVVSTAPSNGHLCNIHSWATFTLLSKHERFINDTLAQVSST